MNFPERLYQGKLRTGGFVYWELPCPRCGENLIALVSDITKRNIEEVCVKEEHFRQCFPHVVLQDFASSFTRNCLRDDVDDPIAETLLGHRQMLNGPVSK
jgi:hypothetical protein